APPPASFSRKAPAKYTPRVWEAPLVPVALAATLGIVLDRWFAIPLPASLLGAVVGIAAWALSGLGRPSRLPLVYLGLAALALGAAYHHWQRDSYAPDDIGEYAGADFRPAW